jgi:hypothetical protein
MQTISVSNRVSARLCFSAGIPLLALSLMLVQPQNALADKTDDMPKASPTTTELGQNKQPSVNRFGLWMLKNLSPPESSAYGGKKDESITGDALQQKEKAVADEALAFTQQTIPNDLKIFGGGINRMETLSDGSVVTHFARDANGRTLDPQGRLEQRVYPAGSSIRTRTTYSDGRIATVYSDGRIVTAYSDGTISTQHRNGSIRTNYPPSSPIESHYADGLRTVTQYRDGTTATVTRGPGNEQTTTYSISPVNVVRYPDGRVVIYYPGAGGIQVIRFPDRRTQVTHPDGIVDTIFPDGRHVVSFPYGSTLTTRADGSRVWTGELRNRIDREELWQGESRSRVYPDRTVIMYTDGRQEILYRTGRKVEVSFDGVCRETAPDNRVNQY